MEVGSSNAGACVRFALAERPASFAVDPGILAPPPVERYSPDLLQRLIDQAACFNVFAFPNRNGSDAVIRAPGNTGGGIGIQTSQLVGRFDIDLESPSLESGVRASNTAGEPVGRLDLTWLMIPNDHLALPDREPPPTQFDPSCPQRFVMRQTTFTFGDGRDGFRSFGTGRTFPMASGGRSKVVVAAIGNIVEGFGKFRRLEGHYTLCGELSLEGGFLGHFVVRIADPYGGLRTLAGFPPIEPGSDPDPGTTYLMWSAQKGKGPDQQNKLSLGPDGKLRGMNIPTQLKRGSIGFAVGGPDGFRAAELRTGEVIGLEVGFGRGSFPDAPPTGTPLSPYQFEGVAEYSFFDRSGKTLGAIRTNVLEGRRFDLLLPGAPGEMAWRFGFFGPIILGTGCFRGVEGIFYGASTSVFKLPPASHVITHLYMARLNDPDGRFRAAVRGIRQ